MLLISNAIISICVDLSIDQHTNSTLCNVTLEGWEYPWLNAGRIIGATINDRHLSSDSLQLKSCINSRVAAADNSHFHTSVRVRFTEEMGNLIQVLASYM